MRVAAEHKRRTQNDMAYATCHESRVRSPFGAEKRNVAVSGFRFRRYLNDKQPLVARRLIEGEHRPFLGGTQIVREPILKRAGAIDDNLLLIQHVLPADALRHAGEIGLQPANERHLQRGTRDITPKPRDLMAFVREFPCDGGTDETGRAENQDIHPGTLAQTI